MCLPQVQLTVGRLMVAVALGGLVLGGYVRLIRPGQDNDRCKANLRSIGLALEAYHADHGSFPPAFVADATGKPIHSWRALLLPYLDEPALAHAYRFDEPWNGPHNARLMAQVPAAYRCPAHDWGGCSSYAVIVGPETAWPGPVGVKRAQILDGTAILAVELQGGIPWLKPRDLTIGPFASIFARWQDRARPDRNLADLRRQGLAASRLHPRGLVNWLMTPTVVRGGRYREDMGDSLQIGLSIAGGDNGCNPDQL